MNLPSRYLFLFITALLSFSCNQKQEKHAYLIGFSQCVGSDLWRKTMLDEMKMELSLHPGAKLIYADADNNSNTQIRQVKEMLDQGIDLLIISPNEAKPLTEIVEQTYSDGIPVIVIDRKTTSNLYTCYVGADNYQIGYMASQYLGNTISGTANILEVMGLPGSSPTIERNKGFNDGLKKFPNLKIKSQVYGDWMKPNAERQLSKISDQLNGIDVVFAHNDNMALAAQSVFKKLGIASRAKFIGIDATPGAGGGLQMISNGLINASMLYPTGGKEAIATAMKIMDKIPFSKELILPSLVIDSSNVRLMNMQWERIKTQQKDIERQQTLLEEMEELYNNQRFIFNILVVALVLTVIFGGLAYHSLTENKKINKSLEQKNEEILNQKNQLVAISAEAKEATEAKLNFFTNISHEFRTPLTLILSPLDDLLANESLQAKAGKNLRLIHKNSIRLLRLVNQLIDYRKIEHHKLQLNASENNLIGFIKESLELFMPISAKKNIDLRLIHKERELMAWFDMNLMDKVFFNLISNALKFTAEHGFIHITLDKHEAENTLYIHVKDNGIGMEPEETTNIFNLFYQVERGAAEGSGLGLCLSKELMQLHKGDILVNSKKWEGSTFTIMLPLGDQHLLDNEKTSSPSTYVPLFNQVNFSTDDLSKTETEVPKSPFSYVKEQSLLIVEDNPELLQYLVDKFSPDYEVFTADNGKLGVQEAYEHVPDLIISDVVLPLLSGNELCNQLKSDIRTSHIPIILLTAKGSLEQQVEGIKNMADAYLTKPFHAEFLMENVKTLIRNRLSLKEHYSSEFQTERKIPISRSIDKKFVNDFAGFIENNLSNEDLNVDKIAKELGLSRVQLYRKIKALMGCTISEYILSRRLKKAKYLLMNERYNISEITYMVGFASATYFSTVFKTKYGLSPSEFKKQL